jgi:carbon storage regulator
VLVLTRKKNESIMIGNDIKITVVEVDGGQIRLGIDAPQDIDIYRTEIYQEIAAENKEAANSNVNNLEEVIKKVNK